jgi:LacI family transcriptional regulator
MANIRDVAEKAGVSPSTVSRVLNESGPVADDTRRRVETAVAELDYVPNWLATGLRSSRTGLVAFVSSNEYNNPFWIDVALGIEEVVVRRGSHMILSNTHGDKDEQDRIVRRLLERQVDGFVLRPASSHASAIQLIQNQRVPVVVLDRPMPSVDVDIVRADSENGAYQLTKLLLDLGHQRIALLNGSSKDSVARMRLEGYRRAMEEAGLNAEAGLVFHEVFSYESGYSMTNKALDLAPRPSALFAANNSIAFGMLSAIQDRALNIPGDLSVVAFDELPLQSTERSLLTTAEQSPYEIGRRAAELLMARITGNGPEEAQHVILPVKVVYRKSCGRCFEYSIFCSP